MTELEIMQRAKMYIDKLADGVDPLTGAPVPDGDLVNNIRISRCLFYVSDILRRVIENGGVVGKPPRVAKRPFALSYEQVRNFVYSGDTPIPVSEIAQRINDLNPDGEMKKLSYKSVTRFLIESGMLTELKTSNGRTVKRPTEAGRSIGIFTEERVGQHGPYTVVLYDRAAQQFVIDNIDGIIAINNAPKGKNTT